MTEFDVLNFIGVPAFDYFASLGFWMSVIVSPIVATISIVARN